MRMAWIPVVPYESYEEYERLLGAAVEEYCGMVDVFLREACVDTWCRFFQGLSWGARDFFAQNGVEVFFKMTKGHGRGWCVLMNQMVLQSLDVAVRNMVQSHLRLGCRIGGTDADKAYVALVMLREVRLAIADPCSTFNNMSAFHDANFTIVAPWDDPSPAMPVGKVQDMKLAFAMGAHRRLGEAGPGLGCDLVDYILSDAFEN